MKSHVSTIAKMQEIDYQSPAVGKDVFRYVNGGNVKRILRIVKMNEDGTFDAILSPLSFPWDDLKGKTFKNLS